MGLAGALVMIGLIGFAAFNLSLRHQRREMIHRERMLALEKGAELPDPEQGVRWTSWNVRRLLLLAGLCWIALGLGALAVLNQLIINAPPLPPPDARVDLSLVPVASFLPRGMQYIGLVGVFLGIAHLIVFFVDRKKEGA